MKRKWIYKILNWLYDLSLWPHTWPWPWSFKVRVWNSLISKTGWLIDIDQKGCESSIHDHDIDFCVTIVGWVDVPDSNRGDFRRQRALDIFSYICVWHSRTNFHCDMRENVNEHILVKLKFYQNFISRLLLVFFISQLELLTSQCRLNCVIFHSTRTVDILSTSNTVFWQTGHFLSTVLGKSIYQFQALVEGVFLSSSIFMGRLGRLLYLPGLGATNAILG